jgi:NAD(P)-dependent dehydrogenase (short-subunit alcohol dehydrogenase family)
VIHQGLRCPARGAKFDDRPRGYGDTLGRTTRRTVCRTGRHTDGAISAAAARIGAQLGKLDVLVNNAGIADPQDGTPSRVSVDVIERVMRTNFLGAVATSQAMLPLLRKSDAGRIVNVSSDLGSITRHGDPTWKYAQVKVLGYCASKAALNMFTVQLAFELKDQGITVNSVNPGFTATGLNGHRGQRTVEEGAAEIVRMALQEHGPSGKFLETGGELIW